MRALAFLTIFVTLSASGQKSDDESDKVIKLCSVCTCSEISSIDFGTDLVLNVECSELDQIVAMPDLDKIEWPDNPNGLKITAAFERLGLSTLGKLPANSMVESLRFNGNNIKIYWPNPFSRLPNLRKLSFARNELDSITADLFTNTLNLEDLDLSYNKLTDLKRDHLIALTKLKRINLQGNNFKTIPIDAIQNLVSLEELDLSKNTVSDVLLRRQDDQVFVNIKHLYLNENKIRVISKESFPDLNSLEFLDLSNNVIESIDEESFMSCNKLTELNLGQNNITFNFVLPASLQIATMKQNNLHTWPAFPADITYIDLSYNRLSGLFDDGMKFNNLEVLNIAGNQLKEFNLKTNLPKLFSLDISYNLLEQVPSSISTQNFPNLELLRLDGNPIKYIYFENIINLRLLYMSELNMLTSVDEKAFSNVGSRSQDDVECFSLHLTNCKSLSEIKDGAFEGASLCTLDISNNNLTSLSATLTEWEQISEGVNLQWNPWDCGCHLQWVLDKLVPLMYDKFPHLLADLRCESPRAVQGLRMVHWFKWTERPMCTHESYMLEPLTSGGVTALGGISYLTIILSVVIIIGALIAVGLTVYLIKTRKQYHVKQAAMKRKRQEPADVRIVKNREQFKSLYNN